MYSHDLLQDHEDGSFDTIPTDLTVSSYSDDDKRHKKISFKENKQLLHELQIYKIELSKKNAIIKTLESNLLSKTSDYEEKIKEIVHQKQLQQTRLHTQFKFLEQELKNQINVLKERLSSAEEKQNLYQAQNTELEDAIKSLKDALDKFLFSEISYSKLKAQPKDTLNLADYIVLKLHEYIEDYQKENHHLIVKNSNAETQVKSLQKQLSVFREDVENEREQHAELKEAHKKLLASYKHSQAAIEHGNYAQENFDRVKNERDRLEQQILDLNDHIALIKSNVLEISQERDAAKEECLQMKNKQVLFEKECLHLEKQIGNITRQWGEAQDKVQQLQMQLDHAKSSREEMIERFIHSKDKVLHEYERNFKEEKEQISTSLRNFYEKEIKQLKEEKNILQMQKEKAEKLAIEVKAKYEQVISNFKEKENNTSYQIKSFENELDLKKKEISHLSISITQLESVLHEKHVEKDILNSKLQTLEKEKELLQNKYDERILYLEKELGEKKAHLDIYEKMDHDFDETLKLAAKSDDKKTQALLESIAEQLRITSNPKISITRCLDLTRKILILEKNISIIEKELIEEKESKAKLQEKLNTANDLLQKVDQPYTLLISTVKSKEDQIEALNSKLKLLFQKLEDTIKEKDAYFNENNELKDDMQKLLHNREEMTRVKNMLVSMQTSKILNNEYIDGPIEIPKIKKKVKKPLPVKSKKFTKS